MFYDILKGEDNLQFNGQAPFFGYADFTRSAQPGAAAGLSDPYGASGAVNPFPSRPPASNINFAEMGTSRSAAAACISWIRTCAHPTFTSTILPCSSSRPDMVLEVSYLGYEAHRLTGLVDVNPFVLGTNSRLYNVGFDTNSATWRNSRT